MIHVMHKTMQLVNKGNHLEGTCNHYFD